jgi:hypothetical protein
LNFTEELWHPHLTKARIDANNFVLVDNFREHRRKNKLFSRLQMPYESSDTLGAVINDNFYDDELVSDTELPGMNATNKGPYNCACKFTLADTPKQDDNNYLTMVNEGGEIEGGMLGEYVNLYDTNSDSENPSAVPESHTNTDPKPTGSTGETVGEQQPQRSQQKIRRGQVNTEPKVEAQNITTKSSYAQNGQEQEYLQSSNNDQNTYVPIYNQQVIPPLIDNQYQNSNYNQQPVGQQQVQYVQQPQQQVQYVQQPQQQVQYVQQPQQQVQYVQQPQQQTQYVQQPQQQTQYVQQPQQQTQYVEQPQQQVQYVQVQPQQQVQYVQIQPQQQTQYDQQQVQYIQQPAQYQQTNYAPQSSYVQTSNEQPIYVQSSQVAQPQMSNYVGTGLNQVPTIIYY